MKNLTINKVTSIFLITFFSSSIYATDSLHVDASGNVGVGLDNPSADLTVSRSGADVLIEDTNATSGIRTLMEMKNNGPVGFKLTDTGSSGEWAFRTGGGGSFIAAKSDISGPVLSFGGDGSVSMGQNPASGDTASNMVLSSTGNLTVKGSFITPLTTYADYVFAEDYKLMPLDQLQDFVNKEKHLPNVLSEAEVRKTNTVNMSQLQIKQLEKIEELTLYTLQQHKQIKKLQAERVSTIQRLASLEKLVTNLASGHGLLSGTGDKIVLK